MKFRLFYIPACLFIFSFIVFGTMAAIYRYNIAHVANKAEENGWPLVAVHFSIKDAPLAIYTLDGSSANLYTGNIEHRGSFERMFFLDDGALYVAGGSQSNFYRFCFPNYKSSRLSPHLITNPFGLGSSYIGYGENFRVYYDFTNPPKMAFTDLVSGELTELKLRSEPPWMVNAGEFRDIRLFVWRTPYYLFVAVTKLGGEYGDFGQEPHHPAEFWKYDMQSGEWSHIIDGDAHQLFDVDPDGKFVSLKLYGGSLIVIDIDSRDVILELPEGSLPSLGRRWFGCVGTIKDEKSGSRGIILFDMENSWERYEIKLPLLQWQAATINFALFEPPPDGLAGMGNK